MMETSGQPAASATEKQPVEIGAVIQGELVHLNARRAKLGRKAVKAFPGFGSPVRETENEIPDTVGLALSGGGVRSAAFCLGALQALNLSGALDRIDYLSTVSGGGYIGSSLSAGMKETKGKFPFGSDLVKGDAPGVQHLRDYSNYLIPHGAFDVLQSIGIYLRGVAANVLLVVPWLLFAAAATVYIHPTREALRYGSQLNIWSVGFLERKFFVVTLILCLLFPVLLMAWALLRSAKGRIDAPEVPGGLTRFFGSYIVVVLLVAFLELQPFAIDSLFDFATPAGDVDPTLLGTFVGPALARWVHYAAAGLAPAAAALGLFGNKLGWLIKGVTETSSFKKQVLSVGVKAAMMISALALPLILWIVYLQFCYGAIKTSAGWQPLFFVGLLLVIGSWFLRPNANSLHRLYRDRLSKAFLFVPKDQVGPHEAIDTLPRVRLSELEDGPYHLINAALNIQASKYANRRGRNADFFLFSRSYVGSQTTGYVPTTALEDKAPEVDLATAMAVFRSGGKLEHGLEQHQAMDAIACVAERQAGILDAKPALHT
jgi:hypothetical protein